MGLREQIQEDMKSALRARQTQRLAAIRLLVAAVKQREVDERIILDDAGVLAVVDKLIKQRRDSITQFRAAAREDLVAREQEELDVLVAYMPQQASAEEIEAEIGVVFAEVGASGPQDMGRVMGVLKGRLAGRADLSAVSAAVRARLSR